ncbi:deleted in malignant brain tumors 1 protein-like isoform X2 [Conger conger]|uniref:deleted in malignant brain tumors 1 protein-like isoform X2 n=1 Tax=Conger conger TaxID=82655 RepID=UPI002A599ED5|nr:deleted in malignant brain tumors 1 protein-like isoform X2 [Conger conger]
MVRLSALKMERCLLFISLSSLLLLSTASSTDVRLVNGGSPCAGRVEVYHRGEWGTVCDNWWGMADAGVVCKQLGCGDAVDALGGAHFGQGSGRIWMGAVLCTGSESSLKQCPSGGLGKYPCNHGQDAGVICSEVRLVGGADLCSGSVEVHHGSSWGTVCDADFDQKDTEVVCRELGCGAPKELRGAAAFGQGEGQVWAEEIQCRGNESQINFCPTAPSQNQPCSHGNDVGLVCSGREDVRLVNGGSPCAGRVEVHHRGEWGTVCDNLWGMADAGVVCRQLGCGDAVDALGGAHFGQGSGRIWMDVVFCTGSESSLKQCPSGGLGKYLCNHGQDAGVICSEVRLVGGADLCSGRVEVHHGSSWSTVCDADFDQKDTEVVCRELGCGAPKELRGAAAFGQGETQVWAEEIQCRGNESQINFCPTAPSQNQPCSHGNDVGLVCSGREDVRLVNGGSPCAGRVEVHHRGEWGTVCDNWWGMADAGVVCRQLGCGDAVDALGGAYFGQGSGRIWMDVVFCTGSESSLKQCPSGGWGRNRCNHGQDAGVICSEVRLVGGADRCSGRVEVHHGSSWGTVCDADFDQLDAEVVCRELGCGAPEELRGAAAFGQGDAHVWAEEIQCRGNESQINFCPTAPSQNQPCSHGNDVDLVCSGREDVRLVNGGSPCIGRVEVYHRGEWGTVCDEYWGMANAGVVCRQLGCGDAVDALGGAHFGQGSGRIWMNVVYCIGSESSLKQCPSGGWGRNRCNHGQDAGVICSAHQIVRLVGGTDLCSGRVEVHHGSSWGTVCDADFDQPDAEVVCRELGCGAPKELRGATAFGQGDGQVWAEEIQCRGNESQINSCPTPPSQNQPCSHGNDVGLVCSGYTESRLAGGPDICSGRVELKYLGTWWTVCDACWDSRASDVLCRQLGCGTAVAVPGQTWFGNGSGPISHDVFDCHGNETRLSQCAVSSWSRAAFSRGQEARVICSGSVVSTLDGTVQLAGESECGGPVEVYYQETWSRVGGSWSSREASVACRQLGCGSAVQVYSSSPSGTGASDVCLTGFECSGRESHLVNCSTPHNLTCSSRERVSIVCSNRRSLRLVGGGGRCAGRVEVLHDGSWGTVCDDSWDLEDAQVVCRQLQCGTALSAPLPSFFGPGNGPVWLDEVGCVGNETSLWDCPTAGWGQTDCGHKEDVGVVCSEFKEMRLSEGCSGNLEVFYNGTWGNVCWNGMEEDTATLICQELNCGNTSKVSKTGPRVESAPNWLDHVKCRPHDSTLWQCPSRPWGENNCDKTVAVLNCTAKEDEDIPRSKLSCSSAKNLRSCTNHWPLRVVGGAGGCSGRLEVFHGGSWRSVCGDSWDMMDARVVCRQLGCVLAQGAHGNATFGTGNGTLWLTEVNCRGTELHLWDCPHSLHSSCRSQNQAGVTCTGLSSRSSPTAVATKPPVTKPPVTPPPGLSIPAVAFLVVGALFFLLLVLLVLLGVLLLQNRALRRALSQWAHLPEPVYEEIEFNPTSGGTDSAPRWGSGLSEDPPSGYEDVGDGKGHSLSGKVVEVCVGGAAVLQVK